MSTRKKRKTTRKIKQNRHVRKIPNHGKRVSKASKWYIPELCVRCKFNCELRVLKGGELLECPKYGKVSRSTEVFVVS